MRLNEFIIICGNTFEVFIGSKAVEEAHKVFVILVEAFDYYHNTGTIYWGGII